MTATPVVGNKVIFSTDPFALIPRITPLADDSFILAWDSDVFGSLGTLISGDLFARHLDPTGNFTSGNFLQSTNDVAHQVAGEQLTTPLLVQESGGLIMTLFNHTPNSGSSEGIGLHTVFLDFEDSPSPGVFYNPLFFGHQFESLTDSVATFQGTAVSFESDDAQSNTHTLVRWFNPDQSVNGSDQQLGNPGETGSNLNAKLLSSGTDLVYAVFTHFNPATGDRDVRFQDLNPKGLTTTPSA